MTGRGLTEVEATRRRAGAIPCREAACSSCMSHTARNPSCSNSAKSHHAHQARVPQCMKRLQQLRHASDRAHCAGPTRRGLIQEWDSCSKPK
jgi:hypothetical protein